MSARSIDNQHSELQGSQSTGQYGIKNEEWVGEYAEDESMSTLESFMSDDSFSEQSYTEMDPDRGEIITAEILFARAHETIKYLTATLEKSINHDEDSQDLQSVNKWARNSSIKLSLDFLEPDRKDHFFIGSEPEIQPLSKDGKFSQTNRLSNTQRDIVYDQNLPENMVLSVQGQNPIPLMMPMQMPMPASPPQGSQYQNDAQGNNGHPEEPEEHLEQNNGQAAGGAGGGNNGGNNGDDQNNGYVNGDDGEDEDEDENEEDEEEEQENGAPEAENYQVNNVIPVQNVNQMQHPHQPNAFQEVMLPGVRVPILMPAWMPVHIFLIPNVNGFRPMQFSLLVPFRPRIRNFNGPPPVFDCPRFQQNRPVNGANAQNRMRVQVPHHSQLNNLIPPLFPPPIPQLNEQQNMPQQPEDIVLNQSIPQDQQDVNQNSENQASQFNPPVAVADQELLQPNPGENSVQEDDGSTPAENRPGDQEEYPGHNHPEDQSAHQHELQKNAGENPHEEKGEEDEKQPADQQNRQQYQQGNAGHNLPEDQHGYLHDLQQNPGETPQEIEEDAASENQRGDAENLQLCPGGETPCHDLHKNQSGDLQNLQQNSGGETPEQENEEVCFPENQPADIQNLQCPGENAGHSLHEGQSGDLQNIEQNSGGENPEEKDESVSESELGDQQNIQHNVGENTSHNRPEGQSGEVQNLAQNPERGSPRQ